MASIGIVAEEQSAVLRVLGAVLHLGNIKFEQKDGDDACGVVREGEPSSLQGVETAARLLGLEIDSLEKTFTTRMLGLASGNIAQTQTRDQAADKRDAMAKGLYEALFLWLVAKLNKTIAQQGDVWGFIGVLDIYGFEMFEYNSFEQLCINYANEKLQRHFNMHIFEMEQAEYSREGIDWSHVDFYDNQPCLDLIDGKPDGKPGVLAALDDVWRTKGEEANKKFLTSLNNSFSGFVPPQGRNRRGSTSQREALTAAKGDAGGGGHANYVRPRVNHDKTFGIKHYAGTVMYTVAGFNDKNLETFNDDIKKLLVGSSDAFVKGLFASAGGAGGAGGAAAAAAAPRGGGGRRGSVGGRRGSTLKEKSVSAQFKDQLRSLMVTLSTTHPRYVRCIKPNHDKLPNTLLPTMCLEQLRYVGRGGGLRVRGGGDRGRRWRRGDLKRVGERETWGMRMVLV